MLRCVALCCALLCSALFFCFCLCLCCDMRGWVGLGCVVHVFALIVCVCFWLFVVSCRVLTWRDVLRCVVVCRNVFKNFGRQSLIFSRIGDPLLTMLCCFSFKGTKNKNKGTKNGQFQNHTHSSSWTWRILAGQSSGHTSGWSQQKFPKFGFPAHTISLWPMEHSVCQSDCPLTRQNISPLATAHDYESDLYKNREHMSNEWDVYFFFCSLNFVHQQMESPNIRVAPSSPAKEMWLLLWRMDRLVEWEEILKSN